MLAIAGCAQAVDAESGGDDPTVFFPTWQHSGGASEQGMLEGRLIERDRCLLLEDETEIGTDSYLPLWPDTYTLTNGSSVAIVLDDGSELNVGDFISLVGGTSTPTSVAEEVIGRSIPARCDEMAWQATSAQPQ
jgi:hypothetical protein